MSEQESWHIFQFDNNVGSIPVILHWFIILMWQRTESYKKYLVKGGTPLKSRKKSLLENVPPEKLAV